MSLRRFTRNKGGHFSSFVARDFSTELNSSTSKPLMMSRATSFGGMGRFSESSRVSSLIHRISRLSLFLVFIKRAYTS